MGRIGLPLTIVTLGVVVSVLHAYALNNFLYWHIPWYDVMMHFLGGVFVSLLGLWLAQKYRLLNEHTSRFLYVINIVLFVFIISLLWETFELMHGLVFTDPYEYAIDTVLDFLMSTVGAMFGFYILHMSNIFHDTL